MLSYGTGGLEEPKKDPSHHKKLLPIEEKESYKWIESSLNSKKVLEKAGEIIIIQDREGDIYEQFCVVPDNRTHLLVRAKAIRELTLMMLETIVKLFIMQIAYNTDEEINPRSCFSQQGIECLDIQIKQLEGKTEKLKNPYNRSDLKRYIWAITRLGGWKGYISERKPEITTFWIGLQKFSAILRGYRLFKDVSRR